MRFPAQPGDRTVWGFQVRRDIFVRGEQDWWIARPRGKEGIVSRFGHLIFDDRLSPPRRLEFNPYTLGQLQTKSDAAMSGTGNAGFDLRVGLGSSATLSATVNPDFGQVEADPAVLNLSVFETFFQERRPFFVQGAGIFRFDVNCSAVNDCSTGEGLFYSRRIGRSPQLADYGGAGSSVATTIYGAAKLTGRLPGGQTLGVLDAVTGREAGTLDRTMEPATNYAVVRGQQDLRGGESGIGVMVTAVNRNRDQWTRDSLRHSAYAGGLDFRHRFA